MPRSFLGASQSNGSISVPVTRVELEHAVSSGAELKVIGADMVPLYEEHTARLEIGCNLKQWEEMDVTEKALVIAQRRIKIALENIQAEAQIRQAKRNSGRK